MCFSFQKRKGWIGQETFLRTSVLLKYYSRIQTALGGNRPCWENSWVKHGGRERVEKYSLQELTRFNRVARVFEYEADENRNTHTKLWEWK
jgi:hypothetical protein